jgi:FkbM family methyltransferase
VAANLKGIKPMILETNGYVFNLRDEEHDPSDDHDLDWKVIEETWTENVYRIHQWQFAEDAVFVDIGANVGSVSLFVDNFNKDREDKIRVFAIEPEPHNLSLLQKNIENNPVENVTVINKAIWHQNKEVLITNRGGNSSIFEIEGVEQTKIQAITLERLFRENNIKHVDVMKIDIEGAEFDLIINASEKTLAKIKYITLEFDKSFDGKFGIMVEKLAKQFGLEILGSPERGGYIYGNRY